MHPAAKIQFERAVREFAQWRAVPAGERSPAPAWWWQPAFEVVAQQEEMPPLCSIRPELPLSSTYAAGAAVLIATLSDQTSLPWPDEFARSSELRRRKPISRVMTRFEFRRRLLGFPGSSSEMAEMIVLSRSCHAWPALPAPPSKGPYSRAAPCSSDF